MKITVSLLSEDLDELQITLVEDEVCLEIHGESIRVNVDELQRAFTALSLQEPEFELEMGDEDETD